ncbi:histidine kinase [Streptomyces sp. TRM68367]|uniref:sensor histidine kinase n=1 Tax=Streptomyces sp. TRM68367 TaxID=2758415 RepID=UPI0029344F17|nr:histidine kinase [Streptomyces sp. TRM68367]
MIARNTLEALAQRPLSFLTSSWPWRSLAFLLSGTVIGCCFAGLAGLLYLLWGGLGPVAVVVVLVVLGGVAWVVAAFERRRLRLVMTASSAVTGDEEPTGPLWARYWQRLRAGCGLRELGYGMAAVLVLWWTDIGVAVVAIGLPVFLMTAPLQPTASFAVALAGPAIGVVLLPIAAYPVAAWAGVRAAMARAVLDPEDNELTQVMESRARLVDAFEVERRRIERDLHDGAQQRLVTLSMKLGLAGLDLPPDSLAARQVREAGEQARMALQELRELIHNIHPQVLTDRGLEPAVRDIAGRSVVPVEVDIALPHRLASQVESTAYFVVCEALANMAKHSRAQQAWVRGRLGGDVLVLEIRDDGVGGADAAKGTGLVGITDRLSVLNGRMFLSSPAGGPTVMRVEIPCNH